MKAAMPPSFCASAITCSVSVVLPPDSGPYTSITRPRGKPPTPRAASIDIEPVGITLTGTSTSRFPRRMIEPLPYCFSICEIARSRFLVFSSVMVPPREEVRLGPAVAGGPILAECDSSDWFISGRHIITRRRKSKRYFHRVGQKGNSRSLAPVQIRRARDDSSFLQGRYLILVEAAAGFAAEPPGGDVFSQQRAGAVFRIAEPLVQDVQNID